MSTTDKEFREYVERAIRAGFDEIDEIAENAIGYFDEDKKALPKLRLMVGESLKEHLAAQKKWPKTTDNDRLDKAFAELEKDGIVARQNFTCCQSCGHAEIGDEIDQARKAGAVTGYTFYHQQDTDSAVDGGGLYLAYGALSGGDAGGVRVGKRITEALKKAGLKVEWDGSIGTRILVEVDWKRRRKP